MLIAVSSVEAGNLIVDGETVTLTQADNVNNPYNTVRVINGGVLNTVGLVYINTSVFVLDSTSLINGTGAGWAGGATGAVGLGPCGGNFNSADGGGGGGYGGVGSDAPDATPQSATCGDSDTVSILNGSGGGGGQGGAEGPGGDGGAAIVIWSDVLNASGRIVMNGTKPLTATTRPGGGGSGGGILLVGDRVDLDGAKLSARGGYGGTGQGACNDCGGGGGGGRIKIFYGTSLTNASIATDVTGGIQTENALYNGDPGTVYANTVAFVSMGEAITPKWVLGSNSTDGNASGSLINHSVVWQDADGLSSYIFSFSNGSFVWTAVNTSADLESGDVAASTVGGGFTFSKIFDDFEAGNGNWSNTGGDTHDWTRDTDGTASTSTGPCAGAPNCPGNAGADNSLWYQYVETSSGSCTANGQTAILQFGQVIDFNSFSNEQINYSFNAFGDDIGRMVLQENTTGTWLNLSVNERNHGTPWFWNVTDLSSLSGSGSLRFHYTCRGSFSGDMTLDSLNVSMITPGSDPVVDQNHTASIYQDTVSGQLHEVTGIAVTVAVSGFSASGSDAGNQPDLLLEVYDGSGWKEKGLFGIDGTGNFTVQFADAAISEAWHTSEDSRDVRLTGIYLDWDAPGDIDWINYSQAWVEVSQEQSFVNDTAVEMSGASNTTSVIKRVNSTAGSLIKWRFYANGTGDLWNVTSVFQYVTDAGEAGPLGPVNVCVLQTGVCYDTIQAAINAATEYQTVVISNDSWYYNESVVINVTGVTLTSNTSTKPLVWNNVSATKPTINITASDVVVERVTLLYNGTGSSFGTVTSWRVINTTVLNNTVSNTGSTGSGYGVYFVSTNLSSVMYNVVDTAVGSNGHGIRLEGTALDNVTWNNVSTSGTSSNFGVYLLSNSTFNNVSYNRLVVTGTSGTNHGVNMLAVSSNRVSFNTISATGSSNNNGLNFQNANYSFASSNVISTSGTSINNHGINLRSSSMSNVVEYNSIFTSTVSSSSGIDLLSATSSNLFVGNNVSTNSTGSYGVLLATTDNNTFRGGNVSAQEAADVFLSGTTADKRNYFMNVIFNKSDVGVADVDVQTVLFNQYELDVTVQNSSSDLIDGATVIGNDTDVVSDVYNPRASFSDVTNSTGQATTQVVTEFIANGTYNLGTILYFNNYTLTTSKSGFTTNVTQVNVTGPTTFTIVMFQAVSQYINETAGQSLSSLHGSASRDVAQQLASSSKSFDSPASLVMYIARTAVSSLVSDVSSSFQSSVFKQVVSSLVSATMSSNVAAYFGNLFSAVFSFFASLLESLASFDPPDWTFATNSTNSTSLGAMIEHRVLWVQEEPNSIDSYVFQFCNGTWDGNYCVGDTADVYLSKPETENLEDIFVEAFVNPEPENFLQTGCHETCDQSPTFGEVGFFVKFNITNVTSSTRLTNVSLCAFVTDNDYEQDSVDLFVWEVDNQTWTENFTSSDDRFMAGQLIDTATFTLSGATPNEFVCLQVTDYLIAQRDAGHVNISFYVNGSTNATGGDNRFLYNSKELGTYNSTASSGTLPFLLYENVTSELWVNDTGVQFSGWANVSKRVPDIAGTVMAWKVYANNTVGQWNATPVFVYTLTEGLQSVDVGFDASTTFVDQDSYLALLERGLGFGLGTGVPAQGLFQTALSSLLASENNLFSALYFSQTIVSQSLLVDYFFTGFSGLSNLIGDSFSGEFDDTGAYIANSVSGLAISFNPGNIFTLFFSQLVSSAVSAEYDGNIYVIFNQTLAQQITALFGVLENVIDVGQAFSNLLSFLATGSFAQDEILIANTASGSGFGIGDGSSAEASFNQLTGFGVILTNLFTGFAGLSNAISDGLGFEADSTGALRAQQETGQGVTQEEGFDLFAIFNTDNSQGVGVESGSSFVAIFSQGVSSLVSATFGEDFYVTFNQHVGQPVTAFFAVLIEVIDVGNIFTDIVGQIVSVFVANEETLIGNTNPSNGVSVGQSSETQASFNQGVGQGYILSQLFTGFAGLATAIGDGFSFGSDASGPLRAQQEVGQSIGSSDAGSQRSFFEQGLSQVFNFFATLLGLDTTPPSTPAPTVTVTGGGGSSAQVRLINVTVIEDNILCCFTQDKDFTLVYETSNIIDIPITVTVLNQRNNTVSTQSLVLDPNSTGLNTVSLLFQMPFESGKYRLVVELESTSVEDFFDVTVVTTGEVAPGFSVFYVLPFFLSISWLVVRRIKKKDSQTREEVDRL